MLYCFSSPAATENSNIIFLLSNESNSYLEFKKRIQHLKKVDKSQTGDLLFVNTDRMNDSEIGRLTDNVKYIVSVGEESALRISDLDIQAEHIATLLSREAYSIVLNNHNKNNRLACGIVIDQPQERILGIVSKNLPKVRTIGVIRSLDKSNNMSKNNFGAIPDGMRLIQETLSDDIHSTIKNLAQKKADAIMALHDNDVYNSRTARNILISSYHFNIPIIGYSSSFVKAGALMGVYSSPESIANDVYHHINNPSQCRDKKVIYPSGYTIEINPQVAKSLGIYLDNTTRYKTVEGR